jgi:hypothetical protein
MIRENLDIAAGVGFVVAGFVAVDLQVWRSERRSRIRLKKEQAKTTPKIPSETVVYRLK